MRNYLKTILRAVEFTLLFFGIPLFFYFESFFSYPSLILIVILAVIIFHLNRKKDFKLRTLIDLEVPRRIIWNQISLVFFTGIVLTVFVYLYKPENLFNLPRENPGFFLILFLAYPILSAYSQEVIFRTFLFSRYSILFKNRKFLVLVSAVTFAFAHIIYLHPLSMLLTFIAGIYLAWIYTKTKSVLFAAILHSLLGLLVFTIGLGELFWLNMDRYL